MSLSRSPKPWKGSPPPCDRSFLRTDRKPSPTFVLERAFSVGGILSLYHNGLFCHQGVSQSFHGGQVALLEGGADGDHGINNLDVLQRLQGLLNLLKEGRGDAFVSAGSTGALHVGASLIVRTLRGIKRPALATMVPAKNKAYLLLDCGANVECRPEMLAAFAVMGSCYVNKVEGRTAPTVALANNGAEESKGTPMLREAHQLLKATPGIRFVGNIEPRDVPNGDVDVVVCDGFTGNVILKLTEGVAKMLLGMLKEMFLANLGGKIAYLLLKSGVGSLKHQMDSEEYGGAPFLGAKQPVIKAHGSSKAKGIKNAIRQAKICVENDLCGTMQSALDELTTSQAD